MTRLIIIAILSALVACYADTAIPSSEEMFLVIDDDDASLDGKLMSRADLSSKNTQWVVISELPCHAPAVAGRVQRVGVRYQGASNVKINRLTVTYTETPVAVDYTPLSTNFMNVMITSHIGQRVNANVTVLRRAQQN